MIPELESNGHLPPGEHQANWEEFTERFGWNEWRRDRIALLAAAARHLREASVTTIWIGGSLITDVDYPNDFDICFPAAEAELARLDPAIASLDKAATHDRFGGDIFPTDALVMDFVSFFGTTRDGEPVGLVRIELASLP